MLPLAISFKSHKEVAPPTLNQVSMTKKTPHHLLINHCRCLPASNGWLLMCQPTLKETLQQAIRVDYAVLYYTIHWFGGKSDIIVRILLQNICNCWVDLITFKKIQSDDAWWTKQIAIIRLMWAQHTLFIDRHLFIIFLRGWLITDFGTIYLNLTFKDEVKFKISPQPPLLFVC